MFTFAETTDTGRSQHEQEQNHSGRAICNLIRETEVEDGKLSRYMCMEAGVGRRLFYGNG